MHDMWRYVLVALVTLAVGGFGLWFLAWWLSLILAFVALVVALMIFKPFVQGSEPVDQATMFVPCPACGTLNPRHAHPRYECYNCGRDFSELSGRYPTLPGRVSGADS